MMTMIQLLQTSEKFDTNGTQYLWYLCEYQNAFNYMYYYYNMPYVLIPDTDYGYTLLLKKGLNNNLT